MVKQFVFSVLVALVLPVTVIAQVKSLDETFGYDEDDSPVGLWMGDFGTPTPSGTVPVGILDVARTGDGYALRMTLSSVGAVNKECLLVSAGGSSLTFELVAPRGTYRFIGEVDATGQRFAGQASRLDEIGGNEEDSSFEFVRSIRPTDLPDSLAFSGELTPQGIKVGMTIVLARTPGGHWVGHVDVPMQFVNGLPLVHLREQEGVIHGELPVPGDASFDVSLDADRQSMTGTFRQSGMELPIGFVRDVHYPNKELARPQHPKPPFPYRTQEVRATHPDGFTLAGTLTLPDSSEFGNGPYTTAVLVSGSGPQDRDESIMGHKPFLVIADYLTRHGIAAMRFDDRGVGDSGGLDTLGQATSLDFATDALAVVNHLDTIDAVDKTRIGLIGHSDGATIAPVVATMTDKIAFIVSMAGQGVLGSDVIAVQRKLLTMAAGVSEKIADKNNEELAKIEQKMRDGATEQEVVDAFVKFTRKQSPAQKVTDQELAEAVRPDVQRFMSPYFRYFMEYDPAEALGSLPCPMLAINGTLDLQVWHEQNLDAIERIVTEAGGDITIKRYEGLNHLFQPATTGNIDEYAKIETTFDEQVLRDILEWIKLKTED